MTIWLGIAVFFIWGFGGWVVTSWIQSRLHGHRFMLIDLCHTDFNIPCLCMRCSGKRRHQELEKRMGK